MSEQGKAILLAGQALSKKQKLGQDTPTAKRVEEQYQKALSQAKALIDEESSRTYIEIDPYCEFVAAKLVLDGFRKIDTEDGILFSWATNKN